MKLFIDTNLADDKVKISICHQNKIITKTIFNAKHCQAEKLLLEIDKLLKKNKIRLNDLDKIDVENRGEGFTSLRIGVMAANALGFALGIPVEGKGQSRKGKVERGRNYSIIKPIYGQGPNIGKCKKVL